ncbi:MAG: 50S ribosomal protein L29 [Gemmatimonadota bacterium]
MKMEELNDMNLDELNAKLAEFTDERFRLRFSAATQVLENPMRLRAIRKDIARIHTILRERQASEGAAS